MKQKNYFLLWLLSTTLPAIYSQGDELKIASPRTNLVVNEPFFVNGLGKVKRFAKGSIQFTVTTPTESRKVWEFGHGNTLPVAALPDGSRQVAGFSFLWFDEKGCFFDNPGTYKVRAYDTINKIESNELEVRVGPLPPSEAKLAVLFNSGKAIATLLMAKKPDETLRPYEELLRDYPNSRYAPYVAYALLLAEYQGLPPRNIPPEFPQKYEIARHLPAPSLFHADALITLALANAGAGNIKGAKEDAQTFRRMYAGHARMKDAEELLRNIEDREKRDGKQAK